MAGNYQPAWTETLSTYSVSGAWPFNLWKAYKLTDETYKEYLYLCKDALSAEKRNFETYVAWKEERELKQVVEDRQKRLRSNPAIYQPFQEVPEAQAWLRLFEAEDFRYPVLVVHAPSRCGKTMWACSLFSAPLKLQVGTLEFFPEGLRALDRKVHDGLVLDDLRDLIFLSNHQEKIQSTGVVEFASTPGGQCAYKKDLYRLPIVVTVNDATQNLNLLHENDFLSNKANVHVLSFSGRPGEVPPQKTLPPRA